jgi:endonuclease/exonuclease/phosphatase family metal-dependent hydrolase
MPGLEAEVGLGEFGTAPSTWKWTRGSFNVDSGNNDEFKASFSPTAAGVFQYAFRYRVVGSTWAGKGEWLYAGLSGPTLEAGEGEAGLVAVPGSGAQVKVATQNLACLRDDVASRLEALAARWASLAVDVIALQEVCEAGGALGNTAEALAKKLEQRTGRPWRHRFLQTHLSDNVTPEGLGLVSALPVGSTTSVELPTQEFNRKALLSLIATPVGMLAAASSHFSFRAEDAAFRVQQAKAVIDFVSDWQTGPAHPTGTAALIAGDFNATPTSEALQAFGAASPAFIDIWNAKHPGVPGYSYPSSAPFERIDYLMARGAAGQALEVAEASQEFTQPYDASKYVSDHSGFTAVLRVP